MKVKKEKRKKKSKVKKEGKEKLPSFLSYITESWL